MNIASSIRGVRAFSRKITPISEHSDGPSEAAAYAASTMSAFPAYSVATDAVPTHFSDNESILQPGFNFNGMRVADDVRGEVIPSSSRRQQSGFADVAHGFWRKPKEVNGVVVGTEEVEVAIKYVRGGADEGSALSLSETQGPPNRQRLELVSFLNPL